MTRQDYLLLLSNSQAFQQMAPGLQHAIKKAKGENREVYAAIFLVERKGTEEAQKKLLDQVHDVIRDMTFLGNHTVQQLWSRKEAKNRSNENPEALLNSL